jgi:hypothetical protein
MTTRMTWGVYWAKGYPLSLGMSTFTTMPEVGAEVALVVVVVALAPRFVKVNSLDGTVCAEVDGGGLT